MLNGVMPSVTGKHFMLSVIGLNVIIPNGIMLSTTNMLVVVMPSVADTLNLLIVVMLNVFCADCYK